MSRAKPTQTGRPARKLPRRLLALVLAATASQAPGVLAETQPRPVVRLPLASLGFPGYVVSLLHAGASMATVHALDSSHVLFTYSLRSLVPRLPGDDANDSDREVAAVLVEVPSGKVLARTRWHLHDHGRYLWSAGRGVFVLRIGSELSALAPLQALASGSEAFRRVALPHHPGQPVLVSSSPDGKILMAESETERPVPLGDEEPGGTKRKHYTIEFFRVDADPKSTAPIRIAGAGAVGSPVLLRLALDGDGYLWAEDVRRGNWSVSFNEFAGRQETMTTVLSSCNPRLSLLSRSEFLVETCRGESQDNVLAAYGFDGHEDWQEPFGQSLQPPTLALAPEAGRFALSRLVAASVAPPPVGSSGFNPSGATPDPDPLVQEIRVYGAASGDLLLHVSCVPVARSAENFDLSPDGSLLAVLAPETLDLYHLPELSAQDRKDLAEAQTMTPPAGSGPVVLAKITRPVAAPGSVDGSHTVHAADEESSKPSETGRSAAAIPAPAPTPEPATYTDTPAPARKPPTLLNPGETPEFKAPKNPNGDPR